MLTGRVPFSCQNVLQIFEAIAAGEYTIPCHVPFPAADLIRKMMCKEPAVSALLLLMSSYSDMAVHIKRTTYYPLLLARCARICVLPSCMAR